MLPPLATLDDFNARFPGVGAEPGQLEALLGDASARVRAFAGRDWVDADGDLEGVPDGVPGIVAAMVARALTNPTGVTQETTGPFNVSYGSSAADRLYLTKSEKAELRGGQRAFTVDTIASSTRLDDPDWWTEL